MVNNCLVLTFLVTNRFGDFKLWSSLLSHFWVRCEGLFGDYLKKCEDYVYKPFSKTSDLQVVSLWVCTITWWFLLDSSNTKATYRRSFFWLAAFRVVRILHGRESWAAGDSHGAEVAKIHCVLLGQFVQMKDLAFIGLIKCFLSLWIQVHPFC